MLAFRPVLAPSPSPIYNPKMLATPPAHAPTPAYPIIPFATLPSFLKNTLPWILSVLSALALVVFLIWDVCLSCKRKKHWVPGHHLILGALCLQFVGSVDYLLLSISDERKLDQTVLEQLSEDILNKEVFFCGERALLCVFMAVILPQISTAGAQRRLSDLVALLIIGYTVYFHNIYELHVLGLQKKEKASRMLSFNSNNVIEGTIFLLWVSLLLAYEASIHIRQFVAYKTPNTESALGSWEEVEKQVLRSWITSRTSHPEYIIARSIFSASTGFLVTVCVVLFALASLSHPHPVGTGLIVLISQWSFISVGWVIVCWRWVTAVVYYSRPKRMEDLCPRTYFWIRVCGNLRKLPMEWSLYSIISMFGLLPWEFVWMLFEMVWFISGMLLCNSCIRRLVMGNKGYNEFTKLCNNETENSDFEKFRPALMHMPWENPVGLWTANRGSIEKAKEQLEKGRSNAHKHKALILLPNQLLNYMDHYAFPNCEVQSGFRFRTAKMTVVTLLTVIIELSTCYNELKSPNMVILKECIDACQNAWKILELVEKKDPETALVNAVADGLFRGLTKRQPRWLGLPLPFNKFRSGDVEAVKASLQELVNKGKQMLNGGVTGRGFESLDCTASIAIQNLEQVCNWINQSLGNNSLEDMLCVIQIWLANVIRSSVLKVKDCVIEECRIEANADMEKEEEKLWNVLYVVGMAKEITEMFQLDVVELHTSRSMEDVICPWIIFCNL